MIPGIAQFQQVLWAVNTVVAVALLVLLVVRRNYRAYPAFSFYILFNLTLGITTYVIYRRWGFRSKISWFFAWGLQAAAILARAIAVVEVCRHFLSRYTGIWAFAKRVLLGCAVLVSLYSGLAARHRWALAIPSADRGLELSIAAVIVVLFLFARYYEVQPESTDRSLAIGFFLYSCFSALNDTILERYLGSYARLWNILATLAFLTSLVLWSWALRRTRTATATEQRLLPIDVYQSFTPQINLRLRALNDQLGKIWKPEANR